MSTCLQLRLLLLFVSDSNNGARALVIGWWRDNCQPRWRDTVPTCLWQILIMRFVSDLNSGANKGGGVIVRDL